MQINYKIGILALKNGLKPLYRNVFSFFKQKYNICTKILKII
ncbi:hypothetical protein [uncultured Gammaproteobacteria bacterium]|nr:hypothetical protein [uncultured Gammaproteobacteria bacterium]